MHYFDAALRHQMHLGEVPPDSIRKQQFLTSQIRLRGSRRRIVSRSVYAFSNSDGKSSHQITASQLSSTRIPTSYGGIAAEPKKILRASLLASIVIKAPKSTGVQEIFIGYVTVSIGAVRGPL